MFLNVFARCQELREWYYHDIGFRDAVSEGNFLAEVGKEAFRGLFESEPFLDLFFENLEFQGSMIEDAEVRELFLENESLRKLFFLGGTPSRIHGGEVVSGFVSWS